MEKDTLPNIFLPQSKVIYGKPDNRFWVISSIEMLLFEGVLSLLLRINTFPGHHEKNQVESSYKN